MTGPMRNRSENLARERDANRSGRAPLSKGLSKPATIPDIPDDWPAICVRFWDAACESGQAEYWESSDYMVLYVLVDELAAYRRPSPIMVADPANPKRRIQSLDPDGRPEFYETHKVSGQMFQALMSNLKGLGLTEGDRRSMSIELQKEQEDDTKTQLALVTNLKDRLKGGQRARPDSSEEDDRQPVSGDPGSGD